MLAQDALPYLQTHCKISSDELEVVCPCRNPQGEMVLLHGRLFQLGSKDISVHEGDDHMVQAEKCQLCAITLHKTDWPEPQWQEATTNTTAFIRQVLAADSLDSGIQAIWGRSYRNGKSPASPQQATTLQMHCAVDQPNVAKMMQRSGFKGLFLTPKLPNGQIQVDFHVLWLGAGTSRAFGRSPVSFQGLRRSLESYLSNNASSGESWRRYDLQVGGATLRHFHANVDRVGQEQQLAKSPVSRHRPDQLGSQIQQQQLRPVILGRPIQPKSMEDIPTDHHTKPGPKNHWRSFGSSLCHPRPSDWGWTGSAGEGTVHHCRKEGPGTKLADSLDHAENPSWHQSKPRPDSQTMQKHTVAMDQQFRELKSLFQQAGTRKQEDDDANMTWLQVRSSQNVHQFRSIPKQYRLVSFLILLIWMLAVVSVTSADKPYPQWTSGAIAIHSFSHRTVARLHSQECYNMRAQDQLHNNPAGAGKLPIRIFVHSFSRTPFWWPWTCDHRVGEASNPGPAAQPEFLRIGVSNPTSIVSKVQSYRKMFEQYQLDMISASETAAAQHGQKTFARQIRQQLPIAKVLCPDPAKLVNLVVARFT